MDLQVIQPPLAKTLSASEHLEDVRTTVVAGLRLSMQF